MPAPVDSRSSLTIWALIFAITSSFIRAGALFRRLRPCANVALLRSQFLRLGYPAVDTAGQANLFADVVSSLRVELGDLRIVKNTEIIELLFDCRRDAWKLFEIVGNAARARQLFETEVACRGCRRNLLGDDRLFRGTKVDAHLALRA